MPRPRRREGVACPGVGGCRVGARGEGCCGDGWGVGAVGGVGSGTPLGRRVVQRRCERRQLGGSAGTDAAHVRPHVRRVVRELRRRHVAERTLAGRAHNHVVAVALRDEGVDREEAVVRGGGGRARRGACPFGRRLRLRLERRVEPLVEVVVDLVEYRAEARDVLDTVLVLDRVELRLQVRTLGVTLGLVFERGLRGLVAPLDDAHVVSRAAAVRMAQQREVVVAPAQDRERVVGGQAEEVGGSGGHGGGGERCFGWGRDK